MTKLLHALGRFSHQHINQMYHAKALTGAIHTRQRLLRRSGPVPGCGGLKTVIAVATGLRHRFAEILQQRLAPATGGFTEPEQRIELLSLHTFALFTGLAVIDHLPQHHHIGHAVSEPGVGGQAIATRTPGFLVVAFHAFWQIHVRYEAHIGFVDAHAERDGGHHDYAVFFQESLLIGRANRRFQARVIRQRTHAIGHQESSRFLDFFS